MSGPVIALFPEASFGAALNCVGIAQQLRRMGARPVFICHPGFTGVFAEYGFREYHLPDTAGGDGPGEADDYWQGFITTHLPHFDLDPVAQLPTYVAPTWEAIVDTVEAAEAGLAALLERIRPDAILLDNVIMFPAIATAGVPWVRVVSCAETEIPDPNVPPYLSGLPPEDAGARAAFEAAYIRATRAPHDRYAAFRARHGLAPLPEGCFLETSPHLNLLLAPGIVRYPRAAPLPPERFVFLEGCVRDEARFDPPAFPAGTEGPLVYMSFGSLGAIDTALTQAMIEVFAGIEARFLVNVGAFIEAFDAVPDNVHLAGWFPQPSVVAQSALFIHHGGNNSFCEALYHGVPSLVMPYCWDGHDNAQRAEAVGAGRHMVRRGWEAAELRAAIEGLLADRAMRDRLGAASRAMQARPGAEAAARAVLELLEGGKKPE
ncbi:glycosyltransferase [Roseovarius sp. SCSIO 43702]|uniref:nucleotide disphospho-sugar-binding domain-containing protein n=1 Tax=Roseovarius sp. SCSIO 43702 TaxID=2823043 RepID=UPI001C738A4E|nr:glycosyltransferase [Roseovarius sp. SCSIO 43702]QYX55986.1 glycosyltransferase [Roseovarius sp. SCSIO 43702]